MAKVLIPCLLYHVRACSLLKYLGQEDLGALVFPSPSLVLMSTTIITVRATTYLLPPMSAMLGVHTAVEQGSTMYESFFIMQKTLLTKAFLPSSLCNPTSLSHRQQIWPLFVRRQGPHRGVTTAGRDTDAEEDADANDCDVDKNIGNGCESLITSHAAVGGCFFP